MKQYAHTPRDGTDRWHDLQQHLEDTARLAKSYAEKFGAGDLAYATAMVHDLGKFNPSFQQRLRDFYAGRPAPLLRWTGNVSRSCAPSPPETVSAARALQAFLNH